MRLTLRTLMAYLDGVLSPTEAAELEAKISESEYAQQLIQRIRSVIQQPRMEAPRLETKSALADANWMAEYLDSTLDYEKVAQLERLCLESDASLAEAVSCHMILTRVLREPTKVSSRLKRRLYKLNDQSADTAPPEAASTTTDERFDAPHHPNSASTPQADIDSDEEGFQDSDRWEDTPSQVQSPPTQHASGSASPATALDTTVPTSLDAPQPLPPGWVEQRRDQSATIAWVALAVSCTALLVVGILALTGQLAPWLAPTPPTLADNSLPTTDNNSPPNSNNQTTAQPDDSTSLALATSNPTTQPEQTPTPKEEQDSSPPPAIQPPPRTDDSDALPGPAQRLEIDSASITLASANSLTALWSTPDDSWVWAPVNETLETPVIVQQFRVSQSHWSWDQSPDLTLLGSARFDFDVLDIRTLGSNTPSAPGVYLERGKMLVDAAGRTDRTLLLQTPDLLLALTPLDPDSQVAVELKPFRMPGADLESRPTRVLHLIGLAGRCNVQTPNGLKLLTPRSGLSFHNESTYEAGELITLPQWTNGLRDLDAFSATELARRIDRSQPLVDGLLAWVDHDRPEVRMTSIETLTELGIYDLVIPTLDNPENRANWRKRLEQTLQDKLSDGPSGSASLIAFLHDQPETGELALRLWNGFSPQQLREGDGELLIECLEHNNLMIRSAALQQLLAITGSSELYAPDADAASRAQRVNAWRIRMEREGLEYNTQPHPPRLEYRNEVR